MCGTARPRVQGNGTGNNLKKGRRVSCILFLCDFYQNTEIQHTHTHTGTKAQRSIYSSGWHLPTWPAACREGWERGSATSAGKGRGQEKTEGNWGGSRKVRRKVKLQQWRDNDTPAESKGMKRRTPLPKDQTRGSKSRAEEGGCGERGN